jgi:CubicO group peptidase (beta-lactamase class C family)
VTQIHPLPRSTPEAQGVSSAALVRLVDLVNQMDCMNSIMLVRHGHVIAEGWWSPYSAQVPHMLFSLSKIFTSTAIGMLVNERKLSVGDSVLSFFPDDAPPDPSVNLEAMCVRHLLSMSTGHDADTLGSVRESRDDNWARAFLAQPVLHEPGTRFVYNSGATYMLSAIVQRVTGQRLLHYLTPRLFEPLGIEGATWQTDPRGIDVGGWGLSVRTEDIAKFGLFYLQKGLWQGRQLVSRAWVDEATKKHVSNANPDDPSAPIDWQQGYGYQFWRCRHNAYRGDGAFGQFCVVLPDQDAVLAITSGVANMQAVLDAVWEHLLPGFSPLLQDEKQEMGPELVHRLNHLSLIPQQGRAVTPTAERVSGRRYAIESNPRNITALSIEFRDGRSVLTVHDALGEHHAECGYDEWLCGATTWMDEDGSSVPSAASGAWTADDTYTAKLCYCETPFIVAITIQFVEAGLGVTLQANVGFGPNEPVHLTGHLS